MTELYMNNCGFDLDQQHTHQGYEYEHIRRSDTDDTTAVAPFTSRLLSASQIYELYLDYADDETTKANSDNETDSFVSNFIDKENYCLLYCCNQHLKRVSLKGAVWTCFEWSITASATTTTTTSTTTERGLETAASKFWKPIDQAALIKFVQCTSSTLRWFESDLSKENVTKLQKQYPNIEFC